MLSDCLNSRGDANIKRTHQNVTLDVLCLTCVILLRHFIIFYNKFSFRNNWSWQLMALQSCRVQYVWQQILLLTYAFVLYLLYLCIFLDMVLDPSQLNIPHGTFTQMQWMFQFVSPTAVNSIAVLTRTHKVLWDTTYEYSEILHKTLASIFFKGKVWLVVEENYIFIKQ